MAKGGNMPAWLYGSLPFIYVGSGAMTVSGLPNAAGMVSGAVLILAGSIVLVMRVRSRNKRQAGARRVSSQGLDASMARAGLPSLEWHGDYGCGHPKLDMQHRRLFELVGGLFESIIENQAKLDVEMQLDELIGYFEGHLIDEGLIMAGQRQSGDGARLERHRESLVQARRLISHYHEGAMALGELYAFLANDLVKGHVAENHRAP